MERTRTSDTDRPVGFFRAAGPGGSAGGIDRGRRHALEVLEFARVLELVAGFAATPPGAARVRTLEPMTDRDGIVAEHARVEAMRTLMAGDGGWNSEPIPELAAALTRLRVAGAAWTGLELRAGITLLGASRRTRDLVLDRIGETPALAPLDPFVRELLSDAPLERALDRVVNDEGIVRDDASPALRKIRRELRGAEGELVRLLERLMARLESHHRVDDASVTVRNGRYVIPVRREGRGIVGGIVHDTSATGATLFVEPPAAVEAGNRIRELEAEELRETERVLREATEALRPHGEALAAALDALVALDALFARVRYALAYGCAPAVFAAPETGFALRDGRHPLLLARSRDTVVPFDLTMEGDEWTLLISGPNTGGKTVLLKAVALVSLMAQAGIPAPVASGSRIAIFDRFFADIGDEQSIEASLSTFSAHLRNLTEIVSEATAASLVLVDELGSGTDPIEGAALGGAILETLTRRATTTLATTHLGALKELAHEVPGVVNASLQFDAVALAPTYRLVKGVPGRSYGLSIARRLAMPESVLARAEQRVPQGERDVTALLEDLERRQQALTEQERAVADREELAIARLARVTEREEVVREKERTREREARQEARRYLLDARQEIERTIRELKAAGAEQIEAAGLEARRLAERRAGEHADALAQAERAERDAYGAHMAVRDAGPGRAGSGPADTSDDIGAAIAVGAAVEVATLGGKVGRVVELRDGHAVVAVGALKVTVPHTAVRRVSGRLLTRPDPAVSVPLMGDQPELEVRQEVDVRGMRVHEVDDAVVQALDAATRADLSALRIIHGKGTGALRERVAAVLGRDPRVRAFRLGLWNEGGAGVTVVEFA